MPPLRNFVMTNFLSLLNTEPASGVVSFSNIEAERQVDARDGLNSREDYYVLKIRTPIIFSN